ncbi:unnamed protein product, partial [Didymodactylos carnosus]
SVHESLLCIWLDNYISTVPEAFGRISLEYTFFDNQEQCMTFVEESSDKTIFLITSGKFGQDIVPKIHGLKQLNTIFVYCGNIETNKTWSAEFEKIHNIYDDLHPLAKDMTKRIAQYYRQLGDNFEQNGDEADLAIDCYMYAQQMLADVDVDAELLLNDLENRINNLTRTTNQNQISITQKSAEVKILLSGAGRERHAELENIRSNKEDITVVWLDKTLTRSNAYIYRDLINKINDTTHCYSDYQECLDAIKKLHERIFLILSGSYAEQYLSVFNSLDQIDSIFIYCMQREKYLALRDEHAKLVEVYDTEKDLIVGVHHRTELRTYANFYFLDIRSQQLTRQTALFLWNQLLPLVLKEQTSVGETKHKKLLEICRDYYRDNKRQLALIDEFEQNYCALKSIVWYSKSSFVHKLVNKALRTHDHEKLNAFGYYINDLRQLLLESCKHLKQAKLKVYRGLTMSMNEIEKLKLNIGNIISFNGFLSTSRSRDVALVYSGRSANKEYLNSVLFEIECILVNQSVVVADIADASEYPEEKEVLFDMGTVFEIQMMDYDKKTKLWIFHLCMTKNQSTKMVRTFEIVQDYIDLAKKQFNEDNIRLLFAKLMCYLGEYSKIEEYFKQILNTLPEKQTDIIHLLVRVAEIQQKNGKFDQALEGYKNILDKQLCHPDIGLTYSKIGSIYLVKNDYQNALISLAKGLEIQAKCLPSYHPNLNQTLAQLTQIQHKMAADEVADQLLKKFETMKETYSIYIYTDSPDIVVDHKPWSKQKYSKVKLMCNTLDHLFFKLKHDLAQYYQDIGEKYIESKNYSQAKLYYNISTKYYSQLKEYTEITIKDLSVRATQ